MPEPIGNGSAVGAEATTTGGGVTGAGDLLARVLADSLPKPNILKGVQPLFFWTGGGVVDIGTMPD